mmetsp:Transcript_50988/g.84516  ORF Transcript_50988/g.84516 Transcript_50988/m.84516 type:complete len:240 (-) Transcript_50988:896-1615(-)
MINVHVQPLSAREIVETIACPGIPRKESEDVLHPQSLFSENCMLLVGNVNVHQQRAKHIARRKVVLLINPICDSSGVRRFDADHSHLLIFLIAERIELALRAFDPSLQLTPFRVVFHQFFLFLRHSFHRRRNILASNLKRFKRRHTQLLQSVSLQLLQLTLYLFGLLLEFSNLALYLQQLPVNLTELHPACVYLVLLHRFDLVGDVHSLLIQAFIVALLLLQLLRAAFLQSFQWVKLLV